MNNSKTYFLGLMLLALGACGQKIKEDKNKKFLEYVDDILNSIKYIKNKIIR
jgi:hypothetical protein